MFLEDSVLIELYIAAVAYFEGSLVYSIKTMKTLGIVYLTFTIRTLAWEVSMISVLLLHLLGLKKSYLHNEMRRERSLTEAFIEFLLRAETISHYLACASISVASRKAAQWHL